MKGLLLVGILVLSAACLAEDVKHVLEELSDTPQQQDSAEPSSRVVNPRDVNSLAHIQATGNALPQNPNDFWWMRDNSPLKDAYDYYKKCSVKGNCSPHNIKVTQGCSGGACGLNIQQTGEPVSQAGAHIDINKNVFFNGQYSAGAVTPNVRFNAAPNVGLNVFPDRNTASPDINIRNNPFFNGQYSTPSGGGSHSGSGSGSGSGAVKAVSADGQQRASKCGDGHTCVPKHLCVNGLVNHNGEGILQVRSDTQICDVNTEVCCRLSQSPVQAAQRPHGFSSGVNSLTDVTAGKSSVPGSTFKFAGGAGFSGGTIQVVADVNNLGETGSTHYGSSTVKPTRDTSTVANYNSVFPSTVDYSNTNFEDVRFASTIKGPAYLPPFEQPRPPSTPRPPIEVPTSLSTYQPSRPTRPPTIPVSIGTPSSPGPFVTSQTTTRPLTRPSTFQPFPSTSRDYLPPSPSNNNQIFVPKPQPSTDRPVVVVSTYPTPTPSPSSNGYTYQTPTPTFGYPTRRPPTSYLPPVTSDGSNTVPSVYPPDNKPEGGNDNPSYVRPTPPPRPTRPPQQPQPQPTDQNNNVIPSGCAAALKCVQEIYCTADGFVSPVPVVLTKEQEQNRVPTTICLDVDSGVTGKCCRDPNYKDPWPSANLVDGVDDGQYKEDDALGQYRPNRQSQRQQIAGGQRAVRADAGAPRGNLVAGSQQGAVTRGDAGKCGVRRQNTQPIGPGPIDVDFSEIPWQAMVLRDSNRSLLCGGAIIGPDAVLTTANCVQGLQTQDVLVKGGEWKLGIDEEPLPFQIVKVKAIAVHPAFQPGSKVNDLALLILEEKFRQAGNVAPICLPHPNQIPTQGCIATGWGKRILQLHAKGAIMHSIDVNIMDNAQCKDTLADSYQAALPNHSPNTLCGYSDRDQCKVDYGSALACQQADGSYVLSGIFSWDTGCKDPHQIGGYIAPDVDWIQATLKGRH